LRSLVSIHYDHLDALITVHTDRQTTKLTTNENN
jgi:hypothetical protein